MDMDIYNVHEPYLDIVLARGQGEAHKADPIDSNDLIPNVELTAASGSTSWSQIRYDHSWEHASPARLHNHNAQYFALRFGNHHLGKPFTPNPFYYTTFGLLTKTRTQLHPMM